MGSRPESVRVHYVLTCGTEETAEQKARAIALEQTVELPPGCFPEELEGVVVGTVESIKPLDPPRARICIAYSIETVGGELTQLINLLFGNVSLQTGVRITRIDWPTRLLERFAGPRFGVDGMRALCRAGERPLLCTALKPMGSSTAELARKAFEFGRAGIDLIKDDHGLADQTYAPFDERVARCQESVQRANRETGGSSLYLPNLTVPASSLEPRARRLLELGCRAVLISPLVAGIDAVRWLSEELGLAVLAHPALAGAFLAADHGIDAEILLGDLFRLAGADGVIFPNVGGRFPFDQRRCDAIVQRLRAPLGSIRPAFPIPAGGIDVDRVTEWIERYGADTIFLIGGSLYARTDLVAAGRKLRQAIDG